MSRNRRDRGQMSDDLFEDLAYAFAAAAIAACIVLGASGCAWYLQQWRDDGPCAAECARRLGLPESDVLGMRTDLGDCACEALRGGR